MDNNQVVAILGRQLMAMREQIDAMLAIISVALPPDDEEKEKLPSLPPVFGSTKEQG